MIFINHYFYYFFTNSDSFAYKIFSQFHIGVSFFFVLSGFLISYNYFFNKRNFSLKRYYYGRIIRILPTFFILSTIVYFYDASFLPKSYNLNEAETSLFLNYLFQIYILDITFLKSFFSDYWGYGIVQGWSLSVEVFFYFLAPIFIINKKPNVLVCIVLILLGFIFVELTKKTDLEYMFWHTIFGRCFEFFVGIYISYIFVVKTKKTVRRHTKFSYLSIGIITLLIFILCVFDNKELFITIILNNFVIPIFGISFFIMSLIIEKTTVAKILSSRVLVLLGKSSYVFYLIHYGSIPARLINFFEFNFSIDKTKSILILYLLISLLSVLIYKVFEEPVTKFLRKKTNTLPTKRYEQRETYK